MKKKQLEHREDYFQRDHKTKNDRQIGGPKEQNKQSIKTSLVLQLEIPPWKFRKKKKKTIEDNTMSKAVRKQRKATKNKKQFQEIAYILEGSSLKDPTGKQ